PRGGFRGVDRARHALRAGRARLPVQPRRGAPAAAARLPAAPGPRLVAGDLGLFRRRDSRVTSRISPASATTLSRGNAAGGVGCCPSNLREGRNAMNDIAPVRRLIPTSQAIRPAKFAHFVLRTGQFDKMAEWYETVLA